MIACQRATKQFLHCCERRNETRPRADIQQRRAHLSAFYCCSGSVREKRKTRHHPFEDWYPYDTRVKPCVRHIELAINTTLLSWRSLMMNHTTSRKQRKRQKKHEHRWDVMESTGEDIRVISSCNSFAKLCVLSMISWSKHQVLQRQGPS